MARPTKQGIDYFPLDCQFDDDTQLFIAENGADALGILVVIWQMIYQNDGYYAIHDKRLPLKIKQRVMADVERIEHIISEAVAWEIFDSRVFEKCGVLTSKGIQKRYFIGSRLKKEVLIYSDLMLIDVSNVGNSVNVVGNPVNDESSGVSAGGNATNVNVKVKVNEDVNENGKVEEKGKVNTVQSDDLETEIFNYWKTILVHPKAKLDKKRKDAIKKALKIGYSPDDLKSAIRGCSKTPHNMGDNDRGEKYDSIDLIFRTADHIDRFMRNDASPPRPSNSADKRFHSNMQAAQEAMADLEDSE